MDATLNVNHSFFSKPYSTTAAKLSVQRPVRKINSVKGSAIATTWRKKQIIVGLNLKDREKTTCFYPFLATHSSNLANLHPKKLTFWTSKIEVWKMKIPFETGPCWCSTSSRGCGLKQPNLKKIWVNLDQFPKVRGEHFKNVWKQTPQPRRLGHLEGVAQPPKNTNDYHGC